MGLGRHQDQRERQPPRKEGGRTPLEMMRERRKKRKKEKERERRRKERTPRTGKKEGRGPERVDNPPHVQGRWIEQQIILSKKWKLSEASIGAIDDATCEIVHCTCTITNVSFDGIGVPSQPKNDIVERDACIVKSNACGHPQTVCHHMMCVLMHVMERIWMGHECSPLQKLCDMMPANGVTLAVAA
jgi:hypothetical protein